jgi:hypothetical protein
MCKSWLLFTGLFLSAAFLFWGCGRRSPVEETDSGEPSASSGSSSSAGQYEGPDTPGAASSGTKYEAPDRTQLGYSRNWQEADQRAFDEIQKQQLEALKAYDAYMKSKEAGNLDAALRERAIQLFEQIKTKLDPLIDKYPDDRGPLSAMNVEVTNMYRALIDDELVK